MKKVLITGASGQLGLALNQLFKEKEDYIIYQTDRSEDSEHGIMALDISDEEAVNAMIDQIKPEIIINCAALTAVDLCETEEQMAYRINALGPKYLAVAADKKDAKAAQYYISKKSLLDDLTSNMLNKELFNEEVILPLSGDLIGARSRLSNLRSAKLIDIELIEDSNSSSKTFALIMDMNYKKDEAISSSSGEQFWNCYMVYESPQTGWKIKGFGH